MSSATDSQSRLAQLVEYQKSELMRQQVLYMQAQQQQLKAGIPGGLVGTPMPFASEGFPNAATAAAMAMTNASMLGSGLSDPGILGDIDQMALLSMQQQSAAAAAAAAAVGAMQLPAGLATAPLSLRPPGSGPSQVSRIPGRFAASRLLSSAPFPTATCT